MICTEQSPKYGTLITLIAGIFVIFATNSFTQETSDDTSRPEQDAITIEEIVVTGQRASYLLRSQIESAKVSLYSDYNDFNTDDDMDVICRPTNYTESLINTQSCWPVFFNKLVAESAQNFAGGGGGNIQNGGFWQNHIPYQQIARQYRSRFDELRTNVLKLANENPSVAESLIALGTLEEALKRKKHA